MARIRSKPLICQWCERNVYIETLAVSFMVYSGALEDWCGTVNICLECHPMWADWMMHRREVRGNE